MMWELAQGTAEAVGEAQGLSGMEWVLIIGALFGGLAQMFTTLGWTKAAKAAKKADKATKAVVQGIEELREAHPELADKAAEAIRAKAKALEVELGPDGLKERVLKERATRRLTRNGGAAILLCILPLLQACAIGPEAETLIQVECEAHDLDLREWDRMSDKERKASYIDSRAGIYEVRHAVMGVDLPPDLQERHDAEAAAEESP